MKISDIATVRSGYLTREAIAPEAHGGTRLIQLRDFNENKTVLHVTDLMQFNDERVSIEDAITEEDVLYLAKGARRFAFHPGVLPHPTLAAGCFHVLRVTPAILPGYLVWFLNHPNTMQALYRVAGAGIMMPVVRKSDLEALEILVPPLDRQRAVAEVSALGLHQLELLDELKEARRRHTAMASMALAQSIME